ncbi:ComF family protein [Candidatus Saccharibacteria bacterium]|nr:ComF family protein [Candidatus Saccharibacteria bacterium]MCA9328589.1 ComF family protein [Candidatus Saccharibacteria bacterium]
MASQIVDSDGTLLCPIPTAPSRVRQRGFDHALHITKRLSRHTKVPYQQLLRRHTNVRQLGASRLNRIRQMEREFEAIKQGEIKGKHVILVDDVFTTGATLSAAAKVLRKAGARRVSAVVFAQKV